MKLAQKLRNYSKSRNLENRLYKELTALIDNEPETTIAYVSPTRYSKEFLEDICGFTVIKSTIQSRDVYKISWSGEEDE